MAQSRMVFTPKNQHSSNERDGIRQVRQYAKLASNSNVRFTGPAVTDNGSVVQKPQPKQMRQAKITAYVTSTFDFT